MLPAGASDELVALYGERIAAALEDEAAVETLTKMGNTIRYRDGAEYAAWWAEQAAQWEATAREIGIYMAE
jgi:tripartite-type tricarboxylate transporter receptor subunit TctC